MFEVKLMKNVGASMAAAVMLFLAPNARAQTPVEDSWQFAVTPYLWLPSINADLAYGVPPGGSGRPDASVGPNDYLSNLSAALMLSGEARKGKFGLFGDFIYIKFDNEQAQVRSINGPGSTEIPVNTGTTTSLSATEFSMAGSYSIVRDSERYLDAFVGFRYVEIKSELNWNFAVPPTLISRTGSLHQDTDLWDGIVGVRGRISFGSGDKWFVPAYLDAGAGSSKFTWQGLVGIGYTFGWGDLRLVQRYLSIEQSDGELIQKLNLSGPAFGATFRF
jgi:hypothetical protein